MEGWISEQGRKLVEKTLVKISEQLKGSGNTNTPEPEELKEVRVKGKAIHPNNGLVCEKPIRRSTPNRTFHRYCSELWSIKANRMSLCPYCKQPIAPGDEITLFSTVPGWSHLFHATDEQVAMPGVQRLGGED